MTPRRRKPKGSSPKSKVKKVLARWSDGLFYVIKIIKVSEIKKRCLVEFEDQSTAYVHFKDLLDEHKEESKACHNCGGDDELENNSFIKCSNCDREFHQHCHIPPIISDSMAKQFICRICVFAACAKTGGAKDTGPMAARFMFMKREFPYDLEHLSWNPSHTSNTSECYCYCGGPGNFFNKMLQCCRCHQWFHEACVQCVSGDLLMGDRFYIFACAHCNYGEEFLKRLDLSWQNLVHISIFHLSMSQSVKYTDLDLDIIPFIKQHADSFGLSKLLNTRDIDTDVLRQKVFNVVTSQSDCYCCGAEVKKKQTLFGLRERIPPPPPSFYVPYKAEKISNLTLTNALGKRSLFKPPKYVNSLPYLVRGANKFIPSTMSLKLREASMARLKSEHNYCSTSDEYSSSSDRDSIVSKENYDANNNSSPIKRLSVPEVKKEVKCTEEVTVSKRKFVAKEWCMSSSDDSEEEEEDPVQRVCPIPFSKGTYENGAVVEELSEMEAGSKFWSLDTAFPEPRDFSGVNNPFLTDIEQEDLREQRKHFLKQLEHLTLTVDNYASDPCPSPLEPPPVCVPSSSVLTNIKGFKGELSKIFKSNGCSLSSSSPTRSSLKSKDNHQSPSSNNKIISPKNVSANSHLSAKPYKSASLTSLPGSKGNNNHDGSNSSDVINGVRISPQVTAKLQKRNGIKRSHRLSNSQEILEEEKRLKAISRCLKNLTPTCGFHFPVLDENHPSVVNGISGGDEGVNDESKNSNSGRRGLKRKHSSQLKECHFEDTVAVDDCGGENVRRSHRSRQTVRRFETSDLNASKSDSMSQDVQVYSSILSAARYNIISLRTRQDNTIDYLIDWCGE